MHFDPSHDYNARVWRAALRASGACTAPGPSGEAVSTGARAPRAMQPMPVAGTADPGGRVDVIARAGRASFLRQAGS